VETKPKTPLLLVAATVLLTLSAGCAADPGGDINAATNIAVGTSVRSLPGVTDAAVTESVGPPDTLAVTLSTAFDPASPDDRASATELLKQAADMVYASRHLTFQTVSVTVYGVGGAQPASLLGQSSYTSAALAAGAS
jgi:hypothetical protein